VLANGKSCAPRVLELSEESFGRLDGEAPYFRLSTIGATLVISTGRALGYLVDKETR